MSRLLLAALFMLFAFVARAQDVRLIQSPVGVTVNTATITGLGSLSVKVPGTFAGPTSITNARFLSYIEIFADSPTMGDYIDAIKIVDDDGVVPLLTRWKFPAYPTIIDFSSDSTGTIAGYYLSQSGVTRISTFPQLGATGREEPQLIPSGLYLKATIHQSGLASKNFRINIVWGRVIQ